MICCTCFKYSNCVEYIGNVSAPLLHIHVVLSDRCDTVKLNYIRKDFECVELGELEDKDQSTEKTPRRVIHFSSGETMEEYSTEEEDNSEKHPEKKDLLSPIDTSKLTWGPYVWFQMWRAATSTVSACDYLGERMASLFGITSAKYQYAIDEFDRMKESIPQLSSVLKIQLHYQNRNPKTENSPVKLDLQ
uniref:Zgc:153383 n=1 Tax=Astyanax mexicanus TaxID=7994 RepID=A0A8B9LP97_ASTMX